MGWRATLSVVALCGAAEAADWEAVATLLEERCTVCHSGEFAPLGLRLDSYEGVVAGSENGPVLVPGEAGVSEIVRRIRGDSQPRMPLDGPPFLDQAEIALLEDWISAGAPGPAAGAASGPAAPPSPPPDPRADGMITWSEVKPIFLRHCIECHSDNSKYPEPPEGLRLDSLDAIVAGGDRVVLVPGNAAASEIIRRVTGRARPRMPLDGPPWLDPAQVALLADWIAGGALDDDGRPAPLPVGKRLRIRGAMTGPHEIDGVRFVVTAESEIRDRPGRGEAAELRAHVDAQGRIVADRLRAR